MTSLNWAIAAEKGGNALVPTYSLVVPAYNEEGVIGELAARLTEVMDALDGDAEAILVDDGSRDRTYELMVAAAHEEPRLRLIRLSRNFGTLQSKPISRLTQSEFQ